jgi:NMD protein affecting ribosome stability and mRNA decay
MTSAKVCTTCGATESKKWLGIRAGRVLCRACYIREHQARAKLKRRPGVCVWAGE